MFASSVSQETINALQAIRLYDILVYKQQKSAQHLWVPLASIHESTPLSQALETMKSHHLAALPIFSNVEGHDGKPNAETYLGLISIYDILAHALDQNLFDTLESQVRPQKKGTGEEGSSAALWPDAREKFASTPVKDILGLTSESSRSFNALLSTQNTLWDLISRFIQDHRVLLQDETDPSHLAIITQTDVLEFLTQDPSLSKDLQSLLKAPSLEIAERAYRRRGPADVTTDPNQPVTAPRHPHVLSVPSDFETWSAFKLLYRHRVSAVAIVDPASKALVECLSATDFRGLDWDTLQATVFLPVTEFLLRQSQRMKTEMRRELVTCHPNEPLEKALKKVSDLVQMR